MVADSQAFAIENKKTEDNDTDKGNKNNKKNKKKTKKGDDPDEREKGGKKKKRKRDEESSDEAKDAYEMEAQSPLEIAKALLQDILKDCVVSPFRLHHL